MSKSTKIEKLRQWENLKEKAKGTPFYKDTEYLLNLSPIASSFAYESKRPFLELKKIADENGWIDASEYIQQFIDESKFLD